MVENDIQLIHRILSGDETAFSALVRKYQKNVHALAWRKIGDFHIAEEIAQDTFLQAYKNLATLRNPNQFAGWLYVIANRLCLKWLQKKKPAIQLLEDTSVVEINESSYNRYVSEQRETAATDRRHEIVEELLERLPESERTVVTLYYLGEMTAKEIGNFLGVSVNTIKSRLRRARERLQAEEHLISETLGSVQWPADFIARIMEEVADIKPAPPSVGKPLLPYIAFGTAALLIMLMIGVGSQYLSRFQRPYNLNAQTDTTVEIIDAPIVVDTQAEPDARNQVGLFDTAGRRSGDGVEVSKPVVPVPVAQLEQEVPATLKQQWKQASAPGFAPVLGLFVNSVGDTYAVSHLGIYRLTRDAPAWAFMSPATAVNFSTAPTGANLIPMAEKDDSLYLVSTDEVFRSSDRGETWTSLGTRPKGTAVGLAITDEALYLALRNNGIFRSEDNGKQWTLLNNEVMWVDSGALVTLENTVFVGTHQGLYRIKPRRDLEKLPLNTTQAVHSLAVSGNNLYVGTGINLTQTRNAEEREALVQQLRSETNLPVWEIFHSSDLGDSWTDITPSTEIPLISMSPGVKVFTAGKALLAIGYTGFHYRSMDGGKTWSDADHAKPRLSALVNSIFLAIFPAVGVNEDTVFTSGLFGLNRSTDGGASWQPFMTGMVATRISNLIAFKNTLYGNSGTHIAKSTDGGMSWKTLDLNLNELGFNLNELTPTRREELTNVAIRMFSPRLTVADGVLYGIASRSVDSIVSRSVAGDGPHIFHLSASGSALMFVPEVPPFGKNLAIAGQGTELHETPKKHTADPSANDPEKTSTSTDTPRQNTWVPRRFAVSGDTFYVEYQQRLFRWRRGEPEWFDTGLIDTGDSDPYRSLDRFTLAVSGETVYVGKRDGHLFRSLDGGNTWKDLTSTLPLRFQHFNEIVFINAKVHVATDAGVLTSEDGENWRTLTDTRGAHTVIDRMAVDDTTVYGAADTGVYQLDNRGKWERILPELPNSIISVAITGDQLYIATERSGIFRASLQEESD